MRVGMLVLSCCVWLGASALWSCKVEVGSDDDDSSDGRLDEEDAGPKGGKTGTLKPTAGKGGGGKGSILAGSGSQADQGGTSGGPDGGTAHAGSGSLPDSISPDDQLSELSAADATALCEAASAEVSAAVSAEERARLGCTLDALPFSTDASGDIDPEMCAQFVEECLMDGTYDEASEEMCDPAALLNEVEDCETTVGEYQDCLRATAQQLADAFENFNCETLSDPAVAEEALGSVGQVNAPECTAVAADCPALVGAGDDLMPAANGCNDECDFAEDELCDDGGPGSANNLCPLGTDCTDCGSRQ